MARTVFITGGARSGKSEFALSIGSSAGDTRAFVATAQALDDEMARRIEAHRKGRDGAWATIEEPLDLPGVLRREGSKYDVMLIDCLTLWLSNLMLAGRDVEAETADLCEAIVGSDCTIIAVSNEVGMGIVPDNESARRFRDLAGALNKQAASISGEAYLMVSGLPVRVK